jgi:putative oxidoreductase
LPPRAKLIAPSAACGNILQGQSFTREEGMAGQPSVRSNTPMVRSLLRIVVGFLFFWHGFQKAVAFSNGAHHSYLMYAACFLELVGGFLIFVGLFTSPTAIVLSLEMAIAYYLQHFHKGRLPINNGGELAVLYCFIFLYFFVAGAGPVSIDSVFRKKSG